MTEKNLFYHSVTAGPPGVCVLLMSGSLSASPRLHGAVGFYAGIDTVTKCHRSSSSQGRPVPFCLAFLLATRTCHDESFWILERTEAKNILLKRCLFPTVMASASLLPLDSLQLLYAQHNAESNAPMYAMYELSEQPH